MNNCLYVFELIDVPGFTSVQVEIMASDSPKFDIIHMVVWVYIQKNLRPMPGWPSLKVALDVDLGLGQVHISETRHTSST